MAKPTLLKYMCKCGTPYLFGGIYCEPVCPGCYPAHKGFDRDAKQWDALDAWLAEIAKQREQQLIQATAA